MKPKVLKQPVKRTGRAANALDAPIRWSISQAAREFGVHHEIIGRVRASQNVESGTDGKYSTRQIIGMVFGDEKAEKLKKIREDAKAAERKNLREEARLIPTEDVEAATAPWCSAIRQRILGSSMTDEEKDDVMRDLESLGDTDWIDVARKGLK